MNRNVESSPAMRKRMRAPGNTLPEDGMVPAAGHESDARRAAAKYDHREQSDGRRGDRLVGSNDPSGTVANQPSWEAPY
ncbi:hypothetical protein GZH47_19605 [Paenibacillus rhizovicinus]|uniref:Uncharacterized protein n=1 Tax=Paenibacillus rhizovicinus TaxID=2704463 RepID=A0A6C0P2W3_9BACL|nr:hypothetical protein [Paenibacillus rhizovicinus]QHW32795.1 hypothetical protein GZH47_19605 [Paenibacillus rhizovicinus]